MTSIIAYLKQHHVFRLSFYHFVSLAVVLLAASSPGFRSGPCNPGFDLLVYSPVLLIDCVLILISIVFCILKGKEGLASLFINLLLWQYCWPLAQCVSEPKMTSKQLIINEKLCIILI